MKKLAVTILLILAFCLNLICCSITVPNDSESILESSESLLESESLSESIFESKESLSDSEQTSEDILYNDEEKVYEQIDVNSDFAIDRIIVMMKKYTSYQPLSYTIDNFKDIGCTNVNDVSNSKLKNGGYLIGSEEFHRRILVLTINSKSKEELIAAINALMQRSDVLFATTDDTEEKIYSNPTTSDNFAVNRLILMMKRYTSYQPINYTPEDFSNIGCTLVADLSNNKIQYGGYIEPGDRFYRRMIVLFLNTTTKEELLQALKTVMEREDVYHACPDWVI